ncbi:MAG TPA: hypothetical protein VF956_02665 [Candidatus Dormibacteraeota bacterium]
MTPLDRLIRKLAQNPLIAGIVLTAVTVVLIGGVVLTMTSAGCGPANALGLKGIANRCAASTAARISPSALPSGRPTNSISSTPSAPPIVPPASQPYPPPASQPYPPPASQPYPPPASAAFPPNYDPGSPAYPTVADASGSGGAPASVNCRLPVYVGPPGSGGFIVFPGNTFIADPASSVTAPSPSPGGPTPSPIQGGYGQGGQYGLTYDHAYSRWLPVPIQNVSADGKRYAFPTADGLYLVTVSSGAVTELGAGRQWTVVSVGADGVYATVPNTAGLWLLPSSGASPRQLTATGYWQAVFGATAYGTPTSAVPQGTANTIQQLNLSTGAITDYFTRPGMQSYVAGFDTQGAPVIYANGLYPNGTSGSEVWIGGLFLMAYRTAQYGPGSGFNATGVPVADSHGVWFTGYYQAGYNGGGSAIVVYIPGSGVYGVSPLGVQLAGGCY